MRVVRYLMIGLSFACAPATFAEVQVYDTPHFRIYSDLDPRYVRFIERNVEAYYHNMTPRFFPRGFDEPLTIYYYAKQSDARRHFWKLGLLDVHFGGYFHRVRTPRGLQPAVFSYRLSDTGSPVGWDPLFHEITHHFAYLNYDDAPAWFHEGLAAFLGEQTRIVGGTAEIGRANPRREAVLQARIKEGFQVDVKRLVRWSDRTFRRSKEGYPLARALFYWLDHTGQLQEYLTAAREHGYRLSVLERMVRRSRKEINRELLRFIEIHCYPAAYAFQVTALPDPGERHELLKRILELAPNDGPTQLEVARHVCATEKNLQACQRLVGQIVNEEPTTAEQVQALRLLATTHYEAQQYETALHLYRKTLDYSAYDESQHLLFFHIADCYHAIRDVDRARQWYRKFLDADWDPSAHPAFTQQALARSHH